MSPRIPEARISLWFDHDAEEAARFYAKTFPGSAVRHIQRVFTAMMGMRRIDVAAIEAARCG